MRILVSGSRDWTNRGVVERAIERAIELHFGYGNSFWNPEESIQAINQVTIVHGACPTGADQIADDFANGFFAVERHPAEWGKYGKRAGFIRNKEMVDSDIDVALFFIKNNSRGATMTLNLANEAGIPTRVYREGKANG